MKGKARDRVELAGKAWAEGDPVPAQGMGLVGRGRVGDDAEKLETGLDRARDEEAPLGDEKAFRTKVSVAQAYQ